METFSTLLAVCAGNSAVPGEFPTQRPVTRSFDVFFDLRLNKRLDKQSWGWWFETLSRPFWRHCNVCRYSYYAATRILDWYPYINSCFCIDLSTANIEAHEIYHTLLCTSSDIDHNVAKSGFTILLCPRFYPGKSIHFHDRWLHGYWCYLQNISWCLCLPFVKEMMFTNSIEVVILSR